MSYNLQIFSCSEPNPELARLATEEGFERSENIFSFRGDTWQVLFHFVGKVEPEDIPVPVFRELPGIGYLTLVNIEGSAPAVAHTKTIPPKVGGSRLGYRCCRLDLKVQARVLKASGWPLAIKRLWLAVAQIVSPFFAEIREGSSPVKSWWWNGIPPALGLAAMIGPPYDKLWPDFVASSKCPSPNFFFIETIEERKPISIIPPTNITQPKMPALPPTITVAELPAYEKLTAMRYPAVWPFSEPFEKG